MPETTKYTPGPWKVVAAEVHSQATRAHVAHVKLAVDAPQQHAANLLLIAAAPELLEACQGIVDDYEHLAFPEDDAEIAKARRKHLDAVRAAIAKATSNRKSARKR